MKTDKIQVTRGWGRVATLGQKIPRVFSFAEWFRTKFRVFCSSAKFRAFYLPRNVAERNYKAPSVFFFYEMVRNGIPSFWYFPRNVSDKNSERFPFRETGGTPTDWIKISVCSVFHGIIFLSINNNPMLRTQKEVNTTVRHVTGTGKDYLRKSPEVVFRSSALLKGPL